MVYSDWHSGTQDGVIGPCTSYYNGLFTLSLFEAVIWAWQAPEMQLKWTSPLTQF